MDGGSCAWYACADVSPRPQPRPEKWSKTLVGTSHGPRFYSKSWFVQTADGQQAPPRAVPDTNFIEVKTSSSTTTVHSSTIIFSARRPGPSHASTIPTSSSFPSTLSSTSSFSPSSHLRGTLPPFQQCSRVLSSHNGTSQRREGGHRCRQNWGKQTKLPRPLTPKTRESADRYELDGIRKVWDRYRRVNDQLLEVEKALEPVLKKTEEGGKEKEAGGGPEGDSEGAGNDGHVSQEGCMAWIRP